LIKSEAAKNFTVQRTEITTRKAFRAELVSIIVQMNECRKEYSRTRRLLLSKYD